MVTYPQDWQEKNLLDCVQLIQGLTYKPENVISFGTLVLRSSNIKNNRLELLDNVFVNLPVNEEKMIQDGDILVCVRNGSSALIGKSCVLKKIPNTTFGAFMSVLRGDKTGFIAKIFESDIVQQQVRNRSSATINQITKKDFESIKIFLPPIEEQKAIAETLSTFDEYIDDLAALIEKKKNIRAAALEDLMSGKIRLPGFSGDWQEKTLGEIADFYSGGTPSNNAENYNGKIPFIRSGEIHFDKTELFITEKGLKNSSASMVQKGNLLYALYGATAGECDISKITGAINQAILCIVPKNFDRVFLKNWFIQKKTRILNKYLQGGQGNLSAMLIKKLCGKFPPIEEQKAIAEILTAMDEEINSLTAEREKVISIREGAMDELLTGKIRLKSEM